MLDLVQLAGDRPESAGYVLLAQEQVRDNVEVVAEREVLVNGRDSEPGRIGGTRDRHGLPLEAETALVGRMDAGDHLDQRRLAGAVVADEGDDLAGTNLEVDVLQRLDRAEALADALQREQRAVRGLHVSAPRPS